LKATVVDIKTKPDMKTQLRLEATASSSSTSEFDWPAYVPKPQSKPIPRVVTLVMLDTALEDLGKEEYIIKRIPRFSDIHKAVMAKVSEPSIQDAALKYNLTTSEVKAILACPLRV
jgi:hypothetical protein